LNGNKGRKMCGIIGYIGKRNAAEILISGLERMEYRGYDSAGFAILQKKSNLKIKKVVGKVSDLKQSTKINEFSGNIGIAHTRWATHGIPNMSNAHPHTDCTNEIVVVHNGIIENYRSIREKLTTSGHIFKTETDTEIIAHLIEELYDNDLESAVRLALKQLIGTYGIAVISHKDPNKIIVARHGSPLTIGIGNDEIIVASDPAAIIEHTKDLIFLDDGEMSVITNNSMKTVTLDNQEIDKQTEQLDLELAEIEKTGYNHFMLKEIYEQPQTIRDTLRGRLLHESGIAKLGGLEGEMEQILNAKQIYLTACGTSWHSALIGEYLIETYAKIPVEVEYASEFRYRNPLIDSDTVVIGISQSGETADTLAALRLARQFGAKIYGICNVVGSTIARETDAGVYLHAGPEIGVASTKAFTSQVTVLALLTLILARKREIMSENKGKLWCKLLKELPSNIEMILTQQDKIKIIAEQYANSSNFLYLGRGFNFPAALEGALKLKEISYIHAEGYPAAEMKHGPIALIDENMPVVFIAPQDRTYDKIISNLEEVKSRGGQVIAIATEDDSDIQNHTDNVIYVPRMKRFLTPILTSVPLQLMAYYIAVKRGCNVDQPRNLAKSVTVE